MSMNWVVVVAEALIGAAVVYLSIRGIPISNGIQYVRLVLLAAKAGLNLVGGRPYAKAAERITTCRGGSA